MRRRLQLLLRKLYRWLQPKPTDSERDLLAEIRSRDDLLNEAARRQDRARAEYVERAHELIEAQQMAGSGPWLVHENRAPAAAGGKLLREANPITSQGAFGDIELALQNVEWRREVNMSWLEFSRWGIQNIILISRLYFIKNPLIQRGINVAAQYVFGRGVEVSSSDDAANEILRNFFEDNKAVLGNIGLANLERRKYYDGNLFFIFFPDTQSTGNVKLRTVDATEIMDIVTDPEDSDTPWFYRRSWVDRRLNPQSGIVETSHQDCWYPALGYEPTERLAKIGQYPIIWENPILHRKCGEVSKWHFGCPLVYAALDWAKAARRFLENVSAVKDALAQVAMTLTTKGGQPAIQGIKSQLQTQVMASGGGNALWDTNPTAVSGSILATGPGTKLEAFKSSGAGGNPEEVRRYILMVCAVFGFPETFFGDVQTGNLATAKSLDRPTELNFEEKQEAWREDLVTIAKYVLRVSKGAPSGRLREAHGSAAVEIVEAKSFLRGTPGSRLRVMAFEAKKTRPANRIEVACNFPAIREGDIPELIDALVKSATFGNAQGEAVGIDLKATVRKLYELNGIENGDELVEEQFPDKDYDPDRTAEPEPAPDTEPQPRAAVVEAALRRLERAMGRHRGNNSEQSEHVHTG